MICKPLSILALCLAAALSGTAMAAPVLRGDIAVAAAIVTVGDLFSDAGPLADRPMFRAPPLGKSGVVTLAEIASAAARLGLEEYDLGTVDKVRVARFGTAIDESIVTELLSAHLERDGTLRDGMTLNVSYSSGFPSLVAEASATPVEMLGLRFEPMTGTFSARLNVAGHTTALEISGRAEVAIAMPHLSRSLPAGALLSPADIEMRAVPVRLAEGSGYLRIEDAVGKQLQRSSRAGVMLRPADLAEPLAINRNDQVTIYYRQGALTLTVKGQSLGAATLGSPVSVLNSMSNRVITGIATGKGAVEVRTGAPVAIAGL